MASRNHINSRHTGTALAALLFAALTALTPAPSAAAQFPKCGAIVQWAAVAYERDKNIRSGNFWGGVLNGRKVDGKYLLSGLMDELFKPTFGTTFDRWTDRDLQQFEGIAKNCSMKARKAGWAASKKRNYKVVGIYNGAIGFIGMMGVMTPKGRIDSYSSIMAHQRKLYAEHKKARLLKDKQLAKARAMKPSKANIDALATMARNPQFIYLRPMVRKNHEIALQNRGVALANQMVEQAMAKFNDFPPTLKGLKGLQAFRIQLQKDLQGIRSSKWNAFNQAYMARSIAIAAKATDEAIAGLDDFSGGLDGLKKLLAYRQEIQGSLGQVRTARWADFEKAYAAALNAGAATAVDDFKEELNGLPASPAGLQQVQAAVGTLFKYRPAPANLKAYQDIASARMRAIKQDIRKTACYEKLEAVDLDEDDRDLAALGPNGETTLGLLICGLHDRGYKFQEYEGAGWFGSTSTLSILNPRGVTLSIDMEKVEAAKGKEMLVGVMVRDATSETKLTLAGWQDYILKLARGRWY